MVRTLRSTREQGAAAVELALVTPILLAMIFGIVEFGSLWSYKAELNNATANGARAFILDNDAADPVAAAKSAITSSVDGVSASDITVCLTSGATTNCSNPACTDATAGGTVEVSVSTDREAITKIFPGSIDVNSSFVVLCQ